MRGSKDAHRLWYRQAAKNWNEALPVGNGRIGGMIYGDPAREQIDLNEDTLWSGQPYFSTGEYSGIYEKAKDAVLKGRCKDAQELLEQSFGDALVQMYLPLGTLWVEMLHGQPGETPVKKYRRELRLDTSLHTVSYKMDDVYFTRKTVASVPHQVLAMQITADTPASVSFQASLVGAMPCVRTTDTVKSVSSQTSLADAADGTDIRVSDICFITGNCPVCKAAPKATYNSPEAKFYGQKDSEKGVAYRAGLYIEAKGGCIRQAQDQIQVIDADEAVLYVAIRTSFNGPFRHPVLEELEYMDACRQDLMTAAKLGFDSILAEAIAEHQRLYRRTELDLGTSEVSPLPTDERLIRHANGEPDPALYALLFHYGRYLTIAASRPGTQPMNLQGIWNNHLIPPWSSNYTLNINTEMNYWPTLAAGLEECYEPLLRMIEELHTAGQKTAVQYYGAPGFVSHHATDLWRTSYPSTNLLPGSCQWGFFPMSSGWLCAMAMDYYRYTRNLSFLERFYPILKDAADFYRALLMEKDGYLILCPSTSPENNYRMDPDKADEISPLDLTATMSMAIVRDVFGAVTEAAGILGQDASPYQEALPRLYPYSIASDGTLNEWYQEHAEWDTHHRHVSHLYGLFPSRQISADTPALMEACRNTLEKRGDESTGWSIAWKINLWARLGDGDRALKLLDRYLQPVDAAADRSQAGGTYSNLLCAHPPFQIDGNFGACRGILEMLVQGTDGGSSLCKDTGCQISLSNNAACKAAQCKKTEDSLQLLPALPSAWNKGALYGYHLSAHTTIDIVWEDGKIVSKQTCEK